MNSLFIPGLFITIKSQEYKRTEKLPFLGVKPGFLVHVLLQFNDGNSLCQNTKTTEIGLIKSSILYKISFNQILYPDSKYNKNIAFYEYNYQVKPVFFMILDTELYCPKTIESLDWTNVVRGIKINQCLADLSLRFSRNMKTRKTDSGIDLDENKDFLYFLKNIDENNSTATIDCLYSSVASIIKPEPVSFMTPFSKRVLSFSPLVYSSLVPENYNIDDEIQGFLSISTSTPVSFDYSEILLPAISPIDKTIALGISKIDTVEIKPELQITNDSIFVVDSSCAKNDGKDCSLVNFNHVPFENYTEPERLHENPTKLDQVMKTTSIDGIPKLQKFKTCHEFFDSSSVARNVGNHSLESVMEKIHSLDSQFIANKFDFESKTELMIKNVGLNINEENLVKPKRVSSTSFYSTDDTIIGKDVIRSDTSMKMFPNIDCTVNLVHSIQCPVALNDYDQKSHKFNLVQQVCNNRKQFTGNDGKHEFNENYPEKKGFQLDFLEKTKQSDEYSIVPNDSVSVNSSYSPKDFYETVETRLVEAMNEDDRLLYPPQSNGKNVTADIIGHFSVCDADTVNIWMELQHDRSTVSKNALFNNLSDNIKTATNELNAAALKVRSMEASSDARYNNFTKNYHNSIPNSNQNSDSSKAVRFIAKTVLVFGKSISHAIFKFYFYLRRALGFI
jgi:hypothetical protein